MCIYVISFQLRTIGCDGPNLRGGPLGAGRYIVRPDEHLDGVMGPVGDLDGFMGHGEHLDGVNASREDGVMGHGADLDGVNALEEDKLDGGMDPPMDDLD
ncbi:hypothetical protein LIER_26700 [Lithospermum erythrorhizon]|uniref:Uncharacterized protein n=1 Tax=Lithospermum erythrorhizon TaxID=34254 RepID=A0AAV3RAJ6_LITER